MVEIQTSPQETAELTVQTQQEKISKAINDIEKESKKNFNNVNELINKNFYDEIEQLQAENIIKIIDNLFKQGGYNKDLKDLKEFLEPKVAKTISSFGQSNEYIADTKITLDTNANAKAQLQIINSQISTLESRLGNNNDLKKIITELKYITNNLNERNKSQLITFLSQNGISSISESTGNTELLQGVNLFLRNISKRLTDIDESNSILNERNENANRFNAFLQTINGGKRENLDNFNDKEDLQRLQTFIEQNPGNKDIMSAYLKMKKTQIKEQNNVHHQDRKVFENILNMLEKEYGENGKQHKEFQQYILDEQFKTRDIRESNQGLINLCKNGLKLNRNGENLDKQTQNIENFCKSRGFNVDQFIKKFNEINRNRIDNNIQQLEDFNILSVVPDEKLKKFTIGKTTETEGDGDNLQLIYNNTVLSAKGNNLVSTLQLQDKAKQQLKTNQGTNFVDENELIYLINNNSDIQKSWYEKILNKVKESQTTQADASETPETPEETAPEELKELNASDIKNVWKYVNATNVATFFNKAIKIENLNDEQKEILLLAQKGLVTEKGENNDIKKLQSKLGFSGSAVDGKFGIKTFNALRQKFLEKPVQKSQDKTDIHTEKTNKSIPTGWTFDNFLDNGMSLYTIDNISNLDKNNFPDNSCVKYKDVTFYKEGGCYDNEIGTNHDEQKDGNGTRYQMDNGGILIHREIFNNVKYISDNQKFTEQYDYDKIKNNYDLFMEILKTLKSNTQNCYSFDGNTIISNNTKSPRYYEKEGALIRIEKNKLLTTPHYYIRKDDKFVDMGDLQTHANYSSSYEIKNEYKKYV